MYVADAYAVFSNDWRKTFSRRCFLAASSIYSSSRKHPVKREPSPKSGSGKAWKNSNNASASSTIEEDGFDEDITDKAVKSSNKEEEEEESDEDDYESDLGSELSEESYIDSDED